MPVIMRIGMLCKRKSTDELLVIVTLALKNEYAECKKEVYLEDLETEIVIVLSVLRPPTPKGKGLRRLVNGKNEKFSPIRFQTTIETRI